MTEYDKLYEEWLTKSIELHRLEMRMESIRFQEERRRHMEEMTEEEQQARREFRREMRMKKMALRAKA